MVKSYLVCFTVAYMALITPALSGAMVVVDKLAIAEAQAQTAKLIKQLKNQLKQLEETKKILETANKQINAIGEMGKITIPSVNFQQISSQLVSDIGCLTPDFKNLMPNLKTENINMGSICSIGNAYRSNLMISKDDVKKTGGRKEQAAAIREIKNSRSRIIADASTKGLAQSDLVIQKSVDTIKAAQEYKTAGSGAETSNERLQVLIEIGVAALQEQARANQLLAQLVKINASMAINTALPAQSDLALPQETE